MATCSFKTKLALSLTAAFSFFALVFSVGGITLAAYLNAIEAEYSNRIDFSDLRGYFYNVSTDAETGKTTYQISNADQLRNLQMLVSLGLFDEDDIFNLTQDISWTGDPMAPIGSDDMPFNSTFNGCGHTITGLQIACYDGRDAGLFGYTSITSEVKNLVLITPTITVYANSDGGTEVSGSPVEAALIAAAKGMPDIAFSENGQEVAGSITVINDSDTSQSTIKGFPQTVQDINGNSYEIIYESSDENLIKAQGDGSFLTYKTETAAPNFDLFAGTITAKVGYLIDDRFGYYVLERYQFNVLGNGLVSTATTEVGEGDTAVEYNSGAFKTIHSSIQEHSTYTGFFIGHCDGKANHLGLDGGTSTGSSNGKIVIDDGSRVSAYSARTLIGMTRKDNPIDASAGDTMSVTYDFDGSINGEHDFSSASNEAMKVKDYQYGHEHHGKGYGYGYSTQESNDTYSSEVDKDSSNQHQNAISISDHIIPQAIQEYSLFAPGTDKATADSTTDMLKSVTSNWVTKQYDDNADTVGIDSGKANTQAISGGLGAGTWTKADRNGQVLFRTYYRLVRGINLNNAFWIWSTKNLSPIFGQNLFYINFKISYIAERSENTEPNQNSFQILFNSYNPDVKGSQILWQTSWNSSHTSNLFWQDLSEPYSADAELSGDYNEYYNPASHPVIDDGNLHSDVISLEIDQENGTFWVNLFSALQNWFWGSDEETEVRYPTFAFGIGSNVDPSSATGAAYSADNHRSTMKFYADLINGPQAFDNSHFIDSNSFDFNSDTATAEGKNWVGDYLHTSTYGFQTFQTNISNDSASGAYERKERGYFNSYFEVANGTKLYVKDFQITFTNRVGNTEDIIYSVDYVNNGNIVWNEDTMSYDSWPTDSNVMIGFDMSQTAGGVTYSFYRNGNTVYGNYSSASYPLQNVGGTGYTDATLTQG